jgi:hypothetical protein
MERRRTINFIQQIRRVWQQVVSIAKASTRSVLLPPPSTQTKIKNYLYGRIRFFLKIIIKILLRANTGFIGDIKTETLLDIYEAKNSNCAFIQNLKVTPSSRRQSRSWSIKYKRIHVLNWSNKTVNSFKPLLDSSLATIRQNQWILRNKTRTKMKNSRRMRWGRRRKWFCRLWWQL